ncbi:MAG: hypothetical protein SH809_10700 [Rhodothermales bacterium]|nr:hypothetical protein [Rhodothermales bacterium]
MHRTRFAFLPLALALFVFSAGSALAQHDASHAVTDGGISVPGWTGAVDAGEAAKGQVLANASLSAHGDMLHAKTGPSVSYWHPENTATGDYTISATFEEPGYMAMGDHPHPYGLFIGGANLGTDTQSYLYCAAYGNGTFIVRGFGPEPFQMNGRRPEANPAVNKAADKGTAVKQEVALSVKGDKVECAINGTVVGSYAKSDVIGAGKIASTDGIYGLRFGHNTEATVAGLAKK